MKAIKLQGGLRKLTGNPSKRMPETERLRVILAPSKQTKFFKESTTMALNLKANVVLHFQLAGDPISARAADK